MYVKKIKLINFRNYIEKQLDLSPSINIFYGDNANGKTNILEAIYVCSVGKSFRTKKDSDMVLFDKEYGKVEIDFEKFGINKNIDFLVTSQNRKQIKINGIKILKLSEIFGNLSVVLFAPEDSNFIKGDPSGRRRYFDILISQIDIKYMFLLQEYYKNLDQKNNLLRMQRKIKEIELDVWDEKLSELNVKIKKIREKNINDLTPFFKKYNNKISEERENAEIIYKTQIKEEKEEVFKKIKEKREIDMQRGFTGIGIHRDDYKIKINDLDIVDFGSQGQIKTAVLSLKLAEKELIEEKTGEKPILLLDDVMSELDKKRKQFIIKEIKDCQVIITCTDINDIDIEEAKTFLVQKEQKIIQEE